MCINTSFKYHRVTCTQSCVITKVHDLLGQPSYYSIFLICIPIKISIGFNALSLPLWHSILFNIFFKFNEMFKYMPYTILCSVKNLINVPRTFKNLVNVVFCCFRCRRCTKYQTCTNCAGFIFIDPDKDRLCT